MSRNLHRVAVYISSGGNRTKKQATQRQQSAELPNENEHEKKVNGTGFAPEGIELGQLSGEKMNGGGSGSSSIDVPRRTSSHYKLDEDIEDIESSRNPSHVPIHQ